MSTEIPIWVNGKIRWLSGIDKKTTCKDVVEVLLEGEGIDKSEAKDFTIMERWKKVERQLDDNSKILKIWTHWGNDKKEVRLCFRRTENEVDSGRGSPVTSGYIPSVRRKRNRIQRNGKPPWAYKETLHPRRLAELSRYDDYSYIKTKPNEAHIEYETLNITTADDDKLYENTNKYLNKMRESQNTRKTSGYKSYHCSNTGKLHSTPFSENHSKRTKCCNKRESKQRIRNSENIEKLMKLILVQGATIQSQLQKLKEREEQIDSLEQERHRERIEKNGRDYLLETYLGSLKDAEIPEDLNDTENENKIKKSENTRQIEARIRVPQDNKIGEKTQSWNTNEGVFSVKPQNKSIRSRSESRAQEDKPEENLKRTLSDNAISDPDINHDGGESFTPENTKEDYENVIELKRIQSQIEMWEKVFRINKKLEKEEENLVRLHMKIKKVQSENYRVAKGDLNPSEKLKETVSSPSNEEAHPKINDLEKLQEEEDCATIKKNLETLRSDLEDNSKEIYNNFTKLIEEDEIVAQKRSCLYEIITDLERTDHEYEMLNEMIAMRGNQSSEQNNTSSFCKSTSNFDTRNTNESFGKELPPRSDLNMKKMDLEVTTNSNLCINSFNLPHAQDTTNQRSKTIVDDCENNVSLKEKIVKISFEEKVRNYESPELSEEKFPKDSHSVPHGALKSILKNRTNEFTKINNSKNEFQNYQEPPQNSGFGKNSGLQKENLKINNSYLENPSVDTSKRIHNSYTSYPCTNPYPSEVNFTSQQTQVFNGQLPTLSTNLKNIQHLNNSHPTEINGTHFPHSTIVTTKALIHNDTDSSTSSDTSGLSSMYSSSITNEEAYVGKSYVLDTLV